MLDALPPAIEKGEKCRTVQGGGERYEGFAAWLWIRIHFFTDPDPDPELDVGGQYGSGSGSNTDPGL